jgi:hypothetical protein
MQPAKAKIKRRSSIVPAMFDFLYYEYCRARLAEMRKQLLIQAKSHEVPEVNFDARHSDGAGDSGNWKHEANHDRLD